MSFLEIFTIRKALIESIQDAWEHLKNAKENWKIAKEAKEALKMFGQGAKIAGLTALSIPTFVIGAARDITLAVALVVPAAILAGVYTGIQIKRKLESRSR